MPQCPTMPKKPTRPTVKIERTEQGGVCLPTKDDAADILLYIRDLERGYK